MDGIARTVNACLAALRPVLHALWRQKCVDIGIFSDECWITSSGLKVIDLYVLPMLPWPDSGAVARPFLALRTIIGLKCMTLKL